MAGGRQKEFDKQQALDSALEVFWQKGYAGASLSDLTQAMGINKPSLYATYGNKEKLYVSAVESYVETYGKPHFQCLVTAGKSLSERVRGYLRSVVGMHCDPSSPGGCLVTVGIGESASELMPAEALSRVVEVKDEVERKLTEFFTEEQEGGALSAGADPGTCALYLSTMVNGLAIMARGGKTAEELERVVQSLDIESLG